MKLIKVKCHYCSKKFQRYVGRFNEAKKQKWHQYCSWKCLVESRKRRVETFCANPKCHKTVSHLLSQFKRAGRAFCSHACSAKITNKERAITSICNTPGCNVICKKS